jgi:phosphocarrier protein HPr
MPSRELRVTNELGIHARPAQHIVKIAARFEADLFLTKDRDRVNGKSIMGVLMLAAEPGSIVKLEAVGADAEDLLVALEELFEAKFHED